MTTDQPSLTTLPAPSGRAGIRGTLRSEFTKIRSVRSTYWSLLALLVISIGIGAAITGGIAAHWSQMAPADRATFDATATSLGGLTFLGELVLVVLGALAITSEYSTTMMRTSLTVMPRRGVLYPAKAAVITAVVLVISLVAAFVSFWLGQALLHSTGASATLSQPNVLRAVIGGALYVTLCGLLAYGVGSMIRHTAGAITIMVAALFVIPILVNLLPNSWHNDLVRWLPSSAGDAITSTVSGSHPHMFSPWGEFLVLGIYTVVVLVAGFILFRNRDA
ncbi:MAG TPA: ABC transporter permease subunit [Streptosporangiaceae bacterium]|nr:ABC transporter permease subunit [Streptosporangiaceae bacterium]